MVYRLAADSDIDDICKLIKAAICNMEKQDIFQWDDVYPEKEDFLADIQKQQLYVGVLDDDIAVVYAVNEECDKAYENGRWKYPDCKYRIIHRLCVEPIYQNRGIAKIHFPILRKNYINRMLAQYVLMYLARILLHYRCILTQDMKGLDLQIGGREDFI